MEIAGVEVDAEPVRLDLADDRQQLIGGRYDAAVILERQEDPAGGGVFTRPMDRVDAPTPRVLLRRALLQIAGEDADGRRVQFRRQVHPPLDVVDLLVELRSRRVGKSVAHRRPGNRQPFRNACRRSARQYCGVAGSGK